jgi:hypothetical protein
MQQTDKKNKIKIFTIRDRLTLELMLVFDEALAGNELDERALITRILALLGREPYASQLLFQDFSQDRRTVIATQSFIYLNEVLVLYRLKPAPSLEGKPGNMHILMESFCRHNQDLWQSAIIQRDFNNQTNYQDFFIPLAKKLMALCELIESSLCEVSKNQRHKYGYLWLNCQESRAQMPEELSLFETLRLLPLPLSNIVDNTELLKLLNRVISSLNERYMLLRACGLDPEYWLNKEEPSIANLEDLRKLRQTAVKSANTTSYQYDVNLYYRCFQELQGDNRKFAGFRNFEEWSYSEIGSQFLQKFASFNNVVYLNDNNDLECEEELIWQADLDYEEEIKNTIEKLIISHPQLFNNPIMSYFFREGLARGEPLCGDGQVSGILEDEQFQQLIAADSRYAGLDKATLARKIYQQAKRLIEMGQKYDNKKRGR